MFHYRSLCEVTQTYSLSYEAKMSTLGILTISFSPILVTISFSPILENEHPNDIAIAEHYKIK
jgi:hypothetical protein